MSTELLQWMASVLIELGIAVQALRIARSLTKRVDNHEQRIGRLEKAA